MSNKASKKPQVKGRGLKTEGKTRRITIFGSILAVATLLGFTVLIPRVTAVVSDPPDANDPFSSSITIANTGFLPLDSVTANISWGDITFLGPQGKPVTLSGDETKQAFGVAKWSPHDLSLDDRFTVSLNDAFGGNRNALVSAQVAVIVKYALPLIHINREKRFPVFAKRTSNGNFYWYSDTLPARAN